MLHALKKWFAGVIADDIRREVVAVLEEGDRSDHYRTVQIGIAREWREILPPQMTIEFVIDPTRDRIPSPSKIICKESPGA